MPWSVGIRFTHASLQVLAEDHGIDLLHIKGPAVDESLLEVVPGDTPHPGTPAKRVARQSIDADVLVRPHHVERLLEVMHRHGWTTQYRFEDGSAFEHAATLVHPFLAPVDVHRRFPGMDAHPAPAFERLWQERHLVPIAGFDCPVPSVTAQRLVLVLHATRAGELEHPDIQCSWTLATDDERAAVRRLAEALGAQVALAAGTGRLGDHAGARGYELWRALSTGEQSRVRIWLARVQAEPTVFGALRTAVRLIVPKPGRMRTTLGRRPTAREVAAAYAQRARWGYREVARLVRASRDTSRGGR